MITTSAFDPGSASTSFSETESADPRSDPGSPTSPAITLSSKASTASPSLVSGATTSARDSKMTRATRPSHASIIRLAIAFAAASRDVPASCASMLLETSMAITRFASRSVNGNVTNPIEGPASAMTVKTMAIPASQGRSGRITFVTPRNRSDTNRRASRSRNRSRTTRNSSAIGAAARSQSHRTSRKITSAFCVLPSAFFSRRHLQPERFAAEEGEGKESESGTERCCVKLIDLFGFRRGQSRFLQRVDAREHIAHGARVGGAEKFAAGGLRDLRERVLVDLAANRRVHRFDLAGERILPLDRKRHRPFAADADRVDLDSVLRRELRRDERIDRSGVVDAVGDENDHATARLRCAQSIHARGDGVTDGGAVAVFADIGAIENRLGDIAIERDRNARHRAHTERDDADAIVLASPNEIADQFLRHAESIARTKVFRRHAAGAVERDDDVDAVAIGRGHAHHALRTRQRDDEKDHRRRLEDEWDRRQRGAKR